MLFRSLSGKDGGIENSKKANILATLVTIQNILGGSQGFCIFKNSAVETEAGRGQPAGTGYQPSVAKRSLSASAIVGCVKIWSFT